MALRIAVVTDAMSDRFFFPIWRRYYGGVFGECNLFVVTYAGGADFADPALGGVVRLPVGYDDAIRSGVVSDFVALLLNTYDLVVRVDVDEFLVVDPGVAPSLRAWLETMDRPYCTARGFDLLQLLHEQPLGDGPVLAQRGFAYPNTALNKTAVTRVPLHWTEGFHWCSAHPAFGPLFLLHGKRIDIGWQMEWFAEMSRGIAGNPAVSAEIKEYYRPDRAKIETYHREVGARPRAAGIESWYREALQARFLASIAYRPDSDLYVGAYEHDHVLCALPPEWRNLL